MSIKKTVCRLGVVLAVAGAVGLLGCEGNGKNNPVGDGDGTAVMTDSTVTISGLTWMRANLNIETPDSWCYGDDLSDCAKYGRYYTYDAAKSACASIGGSWRLPDTADWNKLVAYAGGTNTAGKKLKSKSGWNNNGNGTDDYGFSGLPGGHRNPGGGFGNVGSFGGWWSTAEVESGRAYNRFMSYNRDNVGADANDKNTGASVRCVTGG